MSFNILNNRANVGIVIPDGTELVSFGAYISQKLFQGDGESAALLDKLLSRMDASSLRLLSSQISTSVGDIVSSYNYLSTHPEQIVTNPDMVAQSATSKTYNHYVGSVSVKRITMMRALSSIPENRSRSTLEFVFNDGVLNAKIGAREMPVLEAKNYCEKVFDDNGQKVVIKVDSVMESVAKKAFPDSPEMVTKFMNSKEKTIGNVNLRDSAQLLRNGKISGRVGVPVRMVKMSPDISSYLTSAQGLQAMYINANGKNLSGSEIQSGSEFVSGGADLYRLGINNKLTEVILKDEGVIGSSMPSDLEAKELFFRVILAKDMNGLPVKIPFNFSWLAEEFKVAKSNPDLLDAFKRKYSKLFTSLPLYCGNGAFKYFLNIGHLSKPIIVMNFFKIPKIVDKFIGHYNIMISFYPEIQLSRTITLFFEKNKSTLEDIVTKVFSSYCRSYTVVTAKQGGVTSSGWDDDGEEIPFFEPTEVEYVAYDDGIQIEYIRPNSYGHESRMSSVNNYKPDKNSDRELNSSSLKLQKVVDSLGSNITAEKQITMRNLQALEKYPGKLLSAYNNDEAIDYHIALGAALFTTCPDSVSNEVSDIIFKKVVPEDFRGGSEAKFSSLVAACGLSDKLDLLWDYVSAYFVDEDPWVGDSD